MLVELKIKTVKDRIFVKKLIDLCLWYINNEPKWFQLIIKFNLVADVYLCFSVCLLAILFLMITIMKVKEIRFAALQESSVAETKMSLEQPSSEVEINKDRNPKNKTIDV